MFAEGESNDVIGAEHFSKTTVVCDESGDNAKVSSNLDDVDLLV